MTARVPVPASDWFRRLGWSEAPSPGAALDQVRVAERVVEEFRPLTASLEWRISESYWAEVGVLAFAENKVPYVINNSGWLSASAARVLFASCEQEKPRERLVVVEFGAGAGLFARLFLDAFRDLCRAAGRDYYDRLVYVATDRSPATLRHWEERDLFGAHRGHVEPTLADASAAFPWAGKCRAVFCNYVLDVLPAAIVRKTAEGVVEQLCVRTHLTSEAARLRAHTALTLDEMRALAADGSSASLSALFGCLPLFEPELAFRADGAGDLPHVKSALQGVDPSARFLLNHGATRCLESALPHLEPGGFVLVDDYGPVKDADVSGHSTCQQFGSTAAFGLNFPWIQRFLEDTGATVVVPTGDDTRALHSRLVFRGPSPIVVDEFERCFGDSGYGERTRATEEAREHVRTGGLDHALTAYKALLTESARDWALLGEVAEFLCTQVRDFEAALSLARAALELNPIYSPWLWNVLGDALYCLERFREAHEAYLQAERIDPRDGRTNLNLAYSYLERADHVAALAVIARGLSADSEGTFRERLLEKQQHVLAAIASQTVLEHQRLIRRHERFDLAKG